MGMGGHYYQDEPIHLISLYKTGDGSNLQITEDMAGVTSFPEKNTWDEVFKGSGDNESTLF